VLKVSVFVFLSIFLFVDVVLCKTVLANCLLNAVAFCWDFIACFPLIVMIILGVDGVIIPFSCFIVFHRM